MSAHTPTVASLKVGVRNPLEKHVRKWINERAKGYDITGVAGVLRDLSRGGCASGIVSELIYTADAVKFYRRHAKSINALVAEHLQDGSCRSVAEMLGDKWDDNDPLILDTGNQTLIAWFAFEETAWQLANRAELDI